MKNLFKILFLLSFPAFLLLHILFPIFESLGIGGLIIMFSFYCIIVAFLVFFSLFPDFFTEFLERCKEFQRNFHDRFFQRFSQRNFAKEKAERDLLMWAERRNVDELRHLVTKYPDLLPKVVRFFETNKDFIFGMRFAERIQDEKLAKKFSQLQYEYFLETRQFVLAIDFAIKSNNHTEAYLLAKKHFPDKPVIELGSLAEKAGEYEEALNYYEKEKALYEITSLLIHQKQTERLFDYCKNERPKRVSYMVLETLKSKGLAKEAENLKQQLIEFRETNH